MALNNLAKLEITQGDTLDFAVTFTADGSVIDLTGGTIVCKVHNCGTVLSTATTTVFDDPTSGVQAITFDDAETTDWPIGLISYEIKLTTAAGNIKTKNGVIEVVRNF
jgi:hypothetical protein